MKNKKDYIILIPAYNPSNKLIELLTDLKKYNYDIIIVNDGSNDEDIFNKIKNNYNCILLEYSENKGKGYALKYGIKYYLDNLYDRYKGIITVDADYQHIPSDIENINNNMNEDKIIFGVRNFYNKNIPFANKLGNIFTSFIFKLLYSKKIQDTQTGLRGIPNKYLEESLNIYGDRFEYEMNFLIHCVNLHVELEEVNIETIY